MKNLIFVLIITNLTLADSQPEFYFWFMGANYGEVYKITAEKVGIDPLYVWSTNQIPNRYVKTDDLYWIKLQQLEIVMPQNGSLGWDLQGSTNWLDPPGSGRPDLGRGRYSIKLTDNSGSEIFSFILDTRYTPLGASVCAVTFSLSIVVSVLNTNW